MVGNRKAQLVQASQQVCLYYLIISKTTFSQWCDSLSLDAYVIQLKKILIRSSQKLGHLVVAIKWRFPECSLLHDIPMRWRKSLPRKQMPGGSTTYPNVTVMCSDENCGFVFLMKPVPDIMQQI